MQLKSIVKEICETHYQEKADYIINYLRQNNIEYNEYRFSSSSVNIEVIKKGINPDKEIIFFSHYDIYNDYIDGANDNASSVAVMLAVTKFLYFFNPYYSVKIVFNDSEELIGSLNLTNNSFIKNLNLLEKIGSYNYLKRQNNKKIVASIVLELSGIGDSLYFATYSGKLKCDEYTVEFLKKIAEKNSCKNLEIPISLTDYFSINYFGLKGTVLGAIPYIEGKNYFENYGKNKDLKEIFPHVWKKNHTVFDKYFSIQEKSLNMVYEFVINVIKNFEDF